MKSLAIDEAEVKTFVWPTVFRSMYCNTSDAGISSTLNELGGRKWQLVKVAVDEPKKQTKGYRLLPTPLVTVRDANGLEKSVRLVGGILERDGTYRVSTYYVTPGQK